MSGGVDQRRIELRDINEMITCKICQGYLIDATTVTECLHTFCKSCIVKHLEDSNTCPECEDTIHQSHPLDYIAFDRTMQDLVYKIVPNLEKDEYDRERNFYGERGLPCPKDQQQDDKKEDEESSQDTAGEDDKKIRTITDLTSKSLFYSTTVTHLKKFVATKLLQSVDKYKDLDITCDDEPLYKDHTLKFVYVTRWRTKEPPMRLLFAPKKEVREI
ncbi:PCGF3 [Lepeophtheirus salmonis]|uniref:PCGF3 n=1 Tax=Lepeophtheirus salmonis TaxID=72036 RepID=A0A7R8CEV3_LEPSM|nr:PCGF3 [Lepeophtheirus salmonis]CAF2798788.1 PCGF3 [Lepeophtheirus salmonis]